MQTVVSSDDVSQPLGGTVSSPALPVTFRSTRSSYTPKLDVREISVERWLRRKSPGTQIYYTAFMDKFLVWAGPRLRISTPAEFLEWAERQPKVMLIQDVFEGFAETQKATRRPAALSALKSYLEKNGFERKLPSVEVDATLKAFHRGYTREEIIRLKGFLDDPLQKLYVDGAKDSGLRAADLLSIRYHHIKPDLEVGLDLCHIYFEPEYYPPMRRKKYAGITFFGPNTVVELRRLIAAGRISTEANARIFPFSYGPLTDSLVLAREKAGIPKQIQPSHGLRKFFENALDKPEPPLDDVKKQELEGHSIGVRWFYREQEVDELRPLYKRVYPFLDLSEDAAADRKMKALLDEVKALRSDNTRLRNFEERLRRLENAEGIVDVNGKMLAVGTLTKFPAIDVGGPSPREK